MITEFWFLVMVWLRCSDFGYVLVTQLFWLRFGYVFGYARLRILVTFWLRNFYFVYVSVMKSIILVTFWLCKNAFRNKFGYAKYGYVLVTLFAKVC